MALANFGSVAAAHTAKAVHDGLVGSDAQALAEAYDVLTQIGRQSPGALAVKLAEWNEGELEAAMISNAAQVRCVLFFVRLYE